MAKYNEKNTQCKPIAFDEFVSILESQKEALFSPENIEVNTQLLQRLFLNREFLVKFLCDETLEQDDKVNTYTYQVYLLTVSDYFVIRANVWLPESVTTDKNVFSYGFAHDHNFDLLTLGYFGSGYETLLCEYDNSETTGMPGEQVELSNFQRVRLSEGSVLFMQNSKDVHIQYPSKDLSISLNIMGTVPSEKPQLKFDVENKMIAKSLTGTIEQHYQKLYHLYEEQGRKSICELAESC